jgi:aryl-alcohol dehydrogenase-like predicted oxidoreductase
MRTRRLGDSDLHVSPVVLGAWAIGGLMWGGSDEADAVEAIHASLDAGIDAIDTAPAYGLGRSEEIVGRALAGRRNGVVVATKCGLRWDREEGALRFDLAAPDGSRARIFHDLRPRSIREECEASLRRLRTDRIDLYQIHWPDPLHPLEDAFEELVKLRDEGLILAIGVSNFTVPQLELARRAAAIVSDQPPYNLIDRGIEKEILPWCREHGLGVLAYSPMARGLLSGAIGRERTFPESDHRHRQAYFEAERRARVLDALEAVRPLAEARGTTPGNLAVAWVLGAPGVTAAIVGARCRRQALENARAADLQLDADERRRLGDAFASIS